MDYWREAISCALDEADAFDLWSALTDDQKSQIARALEISHECHGMAFYQPPASDRISSIEGEWKAKLDKLQREFDAYRGNAETAVKVALRVHSDTAVSIGEYGEVLRHGGRTERIQ